MEICELRLTSNQKCWTTKFRVFLATLDSPKIETPASVSFKQNKQTIVCEEIPIFFNVRHQTKNQNKLNVDYNNNSWTTDVSIKFLTFVHIWQLLSLRTRYKISNIIRITHVVKQSGALWERCTMGNRASFENHKWMK